MREAGADDNRAFGSVLYFLQIEPRGTARGKAGWEFLPEGWWEERRDSCGRWDKGRGRARFQDMRGLFGGSREWPEIADFVGDGLPPSHSTSRQLRV